MTYPKHIKLDNEKLKKLLLEKEELVISGREKSMEIDSLDGDLEVINKELLEAEATVDISDLKAEAEALTLQANELQAKMDDVSKRTRERYLASTPQTLRDKYDEIKKKKEEMENDRNKIALKIEQKKDKIIPLIQKLMDEHINQEFDDIDTPRIENGEVICTVFNWLEDWKKEFYKKNPDNKFNPDKFVADTV